MEGWILVNTKKKKKSKRNMLLSHVSNPCNHFPATLIVT